MIEHKAYECEFCGKEFDVEQYEEALQHENNCNCNPKHKKCGSCKYGKKIIQYGIEYIQCQRLKSLEESCVVWNNKK